VWFVEGERREGGGGLGGGVFSDGLYG